MKKFIDPFVISILFSIENEEEVVKVYEDHIESLEALAFKILQKLEGQSIPEVQQSKTLIDGLYNFNESIINAKWNSLTKEQQTELTNYWNNSEELLNEQVKNDQIMLDLIASYKQSKNEENPNKESVNPITNINLGGISSSAQPQPAAQAPVPQPVAPVVPIAPTAPAAIDQGPEQFAN